MLRLPTGVPLLVAGVAGALALPLLAFRAHLPLWLAAVFALAVFYGLKLILEPRAEPDRPLRIDAEKLEGDRLKTAQSLIGEGQAALDRLRHAGRGVRDVEMRAELKRLVGSADHVLGQVRADPSRAMTVRRMLTFYLPNAASVAEGWRALEAGRALPAPERAAQTRETVRALNEAFDRFADDLAQPQLQTLDLDLKVLKDALKADLDERR
jgi:hypothetical protein